LLVLLPIVIMEVLDIGNDFAPEESDDDNQGDAGIQPHRKRKYFMLWQKKDIVQEAYAAPWCIRVTARKYGVQPKQIHIWRNDANALTCLTTLSQPSYSG
jgi:hypothetical protein